MQPCFHRTVLLFAAVLAVGAPSPATVPTPPTLPSTGPLAPPADDPASSPDATAPSEGAPDEGVPSEGVPSEGAPDEVVPSEPAPDQAVPESGAPSDGTVAADPWAASTSAVPSATSESPAAAHSPPVTEPMYEVAPGTRRRVAKDEEEDPLERDDGDASVTPNANDEFNREGVFVSLSAGVANCRESLCANIKIGAHGRFEIGYRVGRFAPFFGLSVGGSRIDTSDFTTPNEQSVGGSASLRFFDVGAGVQFAPNQRGRLDPFFIAALGYSRVREQGKSGTRTFDLKFSRGGLRLGTGLAIYLARRVAVAPRFDIVLPFAGDVCRVEDAPLTSNDFDDCTDVSEIVDDGESPFEERLVRKSFPRPWSVALDLRLVF